MAEIKELVAKANEQCKRIKDYIAENEGMFDSMDLKLHDASFYEYRNMEKEFPLCYADNEECSENSYFYRFCNSTYDQFTDWCAGCGYTRTEARKLYHGGIGEFMNLPNGNGIIRFVI